MCIILFAYDIDPKYLLVMAANRDEFYARPTARACYWEENPCILAGKDLEQAGTWMGVTPGGRLAILTNYRDPASTKKGARSRGLLVRDYLLSSQGPTEYIQCLDSVCELYNGFNLLLMEGKSLWCYSSRTRSYEKMGPGIYGLSNHLLDTPWPKVVRGKEGLARILREPGENLEGDLLQLLSDQSQAPDQDLPSTGVPLKWERLLSSIFIQGENYGTRGSSVLLVDRQGHIRLRERSFGPGGKVMGGDVEYRVSL